MYPQGVNLEFLSKNGTVQSICIMLHMGQEIEIYKYLSIFAYNF